MWTRIVHSAPTEVGPSMKSAAVLLVGHSGRFLQGFARSRHIAVRLFRRDLSNDYSTTLFGCLWNFADPIVIAIAFIVLKQGGIIEAEGINMPFSVFTIYGMLLLYAFTSGLARPLTLIRRSSSILSQTQAPPSGLIGADILRLLFDLAFSVPVLLAVSLAYGAFDTAGFLMFVLLLPCMTLLGLALSLALAPINAIYSDIQQFVGNIQRPLIFVCPTFYRADGGGWLQGIVDTYNPIAILMNNLRMLATSGEWYSPVPFTIVILVSLLAAAVGWLFLQRAVPLLGARL